MKVWSLTTKEEVSFDCQKLSELLFIIIQLVCYPGASFSQQKSNEDSKIETIYNENKNITQIWLKGLSLPNNKDRFSLGTMFSYEGKSLMKTPCCVYLFMSSFSDGDRKYEDNHKITVWADKDRLDLGETEYEWNFIGLWYQETMSAGMKREDFLKISNAKKVKMQIGSLKFQLPENHLQSPREFASKLEAK